MSDFFGDRRTYSADSIDISTLNSNPFIELSQWVKFAKEQNLVDATAMVISTVDDQNMPDSRVVLLKQISSDNKLLFFTNYNSTKAKQLNNNSKIALNFHWATLERQIRMRGTCKKVSKEISEQYFYSRPLESQCAAIVSPQSKVISSSNDLLHDFNQLLQNENKISYPEYWGGYAVSVTEFEFYKGKPNRLNDRIRYLKANNDWIVERIAP